MIPVAPHLHKMFIPPISGQLLYKDLKRLRSVEMFLRVWKVEKSCWWTVNKAEKASNPSYSNVVRAGKSTCNYEVSVLCSCQGSAQPRRGFSGTWWGLLTLPSAPSSTPSIPRTISEETETPPEGCRCFCPSIFRSLWTDGHGEVLAETALLV